MMNYLQYLQGGGPVTNEEMKRYFISSIGNSGTVLVPKPKS